MTYPAAMTGVATLEPGPYTWADSIGTPEYWTFEGLEIPLATLWAAVEELG
jgi:hypothetical protein